MMKKKLILTGIAVFAYAFAFGQIEKEIASRIKKVTVFTKGAQIEREASIVVQKGQTVLKLNKLSLYINEESIRINGNEAYTILTVRHQTDYLNQLNKNAEMKALNNKIEELQLKIEDEETRIKIINKKLDFLYSNKHITGNEQSVNPEIFNSLNNIYGNNLEKLSLDLLSRQRKIADYKTEVNKLNNQRVSLNSKSDLPSGTILVTIEAKQPKSTTINFKYLVNNATWHPLYDIRFLGTDKPLQVTYKANIQQNTGIDWKNVSLILSTAKTNLSAKLPLLETQYLQFYTPRVSQALKGRASGVHIVDNNGNPGAESEIRIRGAGSVANNTDVLYIVDGIPMKDVPSLNPNDIENIETLKDASSTAIYGSRGANGVIIITTKPESKKSFLPSVLTVKGEISNEYIIDAKQSILSNDISTTISFRETSLKADFEYHTIPKLSENIFLIGRVSDWNKAELIDGDVNIYFKNSYIGKSNINTAQFQDTLDVSFGIDNNISIKRDMLKNFSENQFIGNNRKETVAYKLTLRNNKALPVIVKVFDQIPVSKIKDIQVETLELSGGSLNPDSGTITWNTSLNSNENKELILKYSVKYPKNRALTSKQ